MKLKQILAIVLSVALVACISIAATVAYLTDTEEVVNTFTVGRVDIKLDEEWVDYNPDDAVTSQPTERVTENTYKLYPGKTYEKDPTITVQEDSEDCWLFVKVENGLVKGDLNIEAESEDGEDGYKTIADQMEENGWKLVDGTTDIYAYEERSVSAGDKIVVFEYFKIATHVDNGDLSIYDNANITVTAYAIQAEGFDTAEDAWTTNAGHF